MKPKLRILHNLARVGGTVISRCLASMEGVALLSEVHPKIGGEFNDPARQARDWYSIEPAAVEVSFPDTIAELGHKFSQRRLKLVLRTWDHVDFIPSSHNYLPTMRSTIVDALSDRFELIRCAVVRNQFDQFASLERINERPSFLSMSCGVVAFEEMPCAKVSYEAFCIEPERTLRSVCRILELDYDPSWETRWICYRNVTGDLESMDRMTISGGER
jgi:hypothetical protein